MSYRRGQRLGAVSLSYSSPSSSTGPRGEFVGAIVVGVTAESKSALSDGPSQLGSLGRAVFSALREGLRATEELFNRASPTDRVRLSSPMLRELSPREWDVARLVLEGMRSTAIAGELGISVSTVRNHMKSTCRKTGVSSRAEFVVRVRARGGEASARPDPWNRSIRRREC